MLPLWRILPRAQNIVNKSLQTGTCPTVMELPAAVLGHVNDSDMKTVRGSNREIVCMEGVQGETREFSVSEARRVMSLASDYQCQGPSVQGTQTMQENYITNVHTETSDQLSSQDVHSSVLDGLGSHVSLYGCMQTTVPHPGTSSGYGSHLSMPGSGNKLLDKYLAGSKLSHHQSRYLSTSSVSHVSQQGSQQLPVDDDLGDPTPQGIQGDNCVSFKLWMENCQRYNLPNCDEQLESLKNGRKTLAEVFLEQQEIIRLVAEEYRQKNQQMKTSSDSNAQGQQDYFGYSYEFASEPCLQGLQGDDCVNYKLWAHNCQAFGFGDCEGKKNDITTGRRTLQDVFDEQDDMIRKIVSNYQQRRQYSTSSKPEVGTNQTDSESNLNSASSSPPSDSNVELSQKDKLKRAVKEYGGTVIVFHVGISLISLGSFYTAVSCGIDVISILTKLGVGEAILQSKLATGSTTFVVAYAVHKVFAPVRIAITLSCVPFLVRYLRRVGFLKPLKKK